MFCAALVSLVLVSTSVPPAGSGLLTLEKAASLHSGMAPHSLDSALHGLKVVKKEVLDCGGAKCDVLRLGLFQGGYAFVPPGAPATGRVMAIPYFVFRDAHTRVVRACGTHRRLLDSASSSDRPWLENAFQTIAEHDRTEFLGLGREASLSFLRRHLNNYPPDLGDDPESKQVPQVYHKTESVLLAELQSAPSDIRVHRELGDLYRMGRNMGEAGAYERSERELLAALRLDTNDVQARYLLGSLRLRTDSASAALAQPEFVWVRRHGKGLLKRRALWGLALCAWLQGDIPRALEHARAYLADDPGNEPTLFLRETLERELARGTGAK